MSSDEGDAPVFQLVYVSAATCAFDTESLDRLLAKARTNNASVGVSGMLVFHEGSFIQVLEGPRPEVQKLFERIECDPRHTETKILFRGEVDKPSFSDWSMGFYRTSARSSRELPGFSNFLPTGFVDVADRPDVARRALLAFRGGKWRQKVNIRSEGNGKGGK